MTMLAMNEFEVGGQIYRVRDRMNGKTAARMLRRCLPVMSPMLNLGGKTPTMDDIKHVVGEIGKLSDETEDYIFDNCFSIVDRKQGETWAPLKPKNVADIMFNDIDVMDRYTIVANVISREFGPVFQKLLASLPAGAGSNPA